MSNSKGTRGGAASKGKKSTRPGAEEAREDVLQAVLIADSFQSRYAPFVVEKPRCLLPLANVPLIEYTLEFLAMNGVQEVFVYCGSHHDQIERYVHDSRWSPIARSCPFSLLEFIRVADARSVGDFLRDLDKRNIIGSDFILVHGDLVSNISLDGALAAHRARREANRDSCMTMVLREVAEEEHSTKMKGLTPVFVVDPRAKRCLHYEETNPFQPERYIDLDPTVLENCEAETRTDLIDAHIDICTPDVLALWSESFDYELPRANFLHGVLKDWELNGKMIHTEIVREGYSARATNLQMYDAISRDILRGWTYPFTPDCNLLKGQTYRLVDDNVYQEDDVTIGDDCDLLDAVLGKETQVGSGSTVINSIIGRNCKIGENVRITNSFIWDDVTINDGAKVEHSIVADMVTIGKATTVEEGSLVSFGVRIDEKVHVDAGTRISLLDHKANPASNQPGVVGPQGKGAIFRDPEDNEVAEDDPSRLMKSLIYSLDGFDVCSSSVSTFADDDFESDDDSEEALTPSQPTSRSRLSSFASDDGTGPNFHSDAVAGLTEALRVTSGTFDAEKLEFTSLRLSNNASDAAIRRAIATAFVRRGVELMNPDDGAIEPAKAAKILFTSRQGVPHFVGEMGVGTDGAVPDQVELTLAFQKSCVSNARALDGGKAGNFLAAMLQQMYDVDVLEEEGILAWWKDDRANEGENMAAIRSKCQTLVDWLENADEESSEEEEESDDDDDD
ncbi:nucleotide-diphospho-sugar transferase [Xylariomycetidae sp. FL2044]|nr:nucleotide-diphospho-sugar transferase [Xylariomycetidae sp. FL2044]